MAGIEVGDTVYVLRDWPTRQIKATVLEVSTYPKYPKGRQRGYKVKTDSGSTHHVMLNDYHYSLPKRVVRKTPFPNVEIAEYDEWITLEKKGDG